MALTNDAANKIAEGIVGYIGKGIIPEGQSINYWLRAAKEAIQYVAKMVKNDFVVDVSAAMTATPVELKAGAAYPTAALAKNVKTSAVHVDLFNKSSATPGTDTSLYTMAKFYLEAASATTPSVKGQVWLPYLAFTSKYDVTACLASDDATGVTAAEATFWSFRYNN